MPQNTEQIKPTLQALVLADYVHIDTATGKKTILGTFSKIITQKLPGNLEQRTFAYISLTGIYGQVGISLRYVDLSRDLVLMECKDLKVSAPDPLDTVETIVPIPTFPLPHEGAYSFELYIDEQYLGSLRINVTKKEVLK